MDEGQLIENTCNKVCGMTLNLTSVHKWAMTGTPIQKSLNGKLNIITFNILCLVLININNSFIINTQNINHVMHYHT